MVWQEAHWANPLEPQIAREAQLQEQFEQEGLPCVFWRLLLGVEQTTGAEVLIGGTSITCPQYLCAMWTGIAHGGPLEMHGHTGRPTHQKIV